MLIPLCSHCHNPTCFSPQVAILREYKYILCAGTTKCVSRYNYQIKEQRVICYIYIWTCILLTLYTKCVSTPWGWTLEDWNMWECNSLNKMVLTYITALVRFLCKMDTIGSFEPFYLLSVLLRYKCMKLTDVTNVNYFISL